MLKSKPVANPLKLVIRRLPPLLEETMFKEKLLSSYEPQIENWYFVAGDMSLGKFAFSRAYIQFKNEESLKQFELQYQGHVFRDTRGTEHHAVVEYAPFQKMYRKQAPKRFKPDVKVGTIQEDPEYKAFLESLNAPPPPVSSNINAIVMDIGLADQNKDKPTSTPLIEYLRKLKGRNENATRFDRGEKRKEEKTKRRERRSRKERGSRKERKSKKNKEQNKSNSGSADSNKKSRREKREPQSVTSINSPASFPPLSATLRILPRPKTN